MQTSLQLTMMDTILKFAENFTYLGAIISSALSIDVEINSTVAKAIEVMAKLDKRT